MTVETERVRDYRDEADIDEFLDLIRVVRREQAKQLYRDCLDIAYRQGRVDGMEAAVRTLESLET